MGESHPQNVPEPSSVSDLPNLGLPVSLSLAGKDKMIDILSFVNRNDIIFIKKKTAVKSGLDEV